MINGIKVTGSTHIMHSLFVDDVKIFGAGNVQEWSHIKLLIEKFCGASRMTISLHKLVFRNFDINQDTINMITSLFTFNWKPLDEGFTYLGFHLKPNNYLFKD